MYFVLLLTALTTVMGVIENMNNSVQEHLLGIGCSDTNIAKVLPLFSRQLFACPVSTGTHSFTIRNPDSSIIAYWSADGPNCAALLNGQSATYYQTYSNEGTASSLVTVNGAPCNADPCCLVVQCGDLTGCSLNFDYSWTATPAGVANILGTIIGSVVGVLVFCICGCVSYCRYKHTCCFKSKSVSIPVDAMRRSDGTLIVNNKV
jgi:hypothetical protein